MLLNTEPYYSPSLSALQGHDYGKVPTGILPGCETLPDSCREPFPRRVESIGDDATSVIQVCARVQSLCRVDRHCWLSPSSSSMTATRWVCADRVRHEALYCADQRWRCVCLGLWLCTHAHRWSHPRLHASASVSRWHCSEGQAHLRWRQRVPHMLKRWSESMPRYAAYEVKGVQLEACYALCYIVKAASPAALTAIRATRVAKLLRQGDVP